jgi:polyisoprenyl-teichoic acid--peptidoglycan teichoic acid transferase
VDEVMGLEPRKVKHGKKKRRMLIKIIASIVLVISAGIGIYAYSIYNEVKETVNTKIYRTVQSIDHTPEQKEKMEKKEPLNILLMGVDEREYDKGRSDTLIIMSINPNINSTQLISIPRDSRTNIVGMDFQDKINHSYAFGGTDMTVATVEEFANIELDYYVKINMEGLIQLVDALGGITVQNELDWYDTGYYEIGFHYAEGELDLNGLQAMGFVQMRYQDPAGDFGRNFRQRQVIEAILKKGASVGTIGKIDEVLTVLGNNVETNMNFDDMKHLFQHYRDARNHIETYQVTGESRIIEDVYYLLVSDEERKKINKMIKDFNN